MNQRERVIAAIKHKNTDIIPYQLDLTQSVYDKLCDYYGDTEFLYHIVGNHLIREKNKKHTFLDARTYVDIFGVTWYKDQEGGDIGNVKEYIFNEPDIKLFTFPEPDAELIKSKCEMIVNSHPNLFKIYEIGFALFERAWTLRGFENLLMDFMLEEDFVNELLDGILEYNLKVIDLAAQYPIDCFMFGDDWGQQKGLIMGPSLWNKYIKPRMSVMFDRVKKNNLYIAHHSCGDNYILFKDLIEMGLDIYNTFQPEVYDLRKFVEEYGSSITVYGGISTQGVLSKGSPENVREETKRMMNVLGKKGGYIVAPTHQIPSDIPLENILAFIETVKGQ
jgi:uroporphyrinogen decarboxylase